MIKNLIDSYLSLRRNLGYKLACEGRLLHNYARFADARGDEFVRAKTALEWAALAPSPEQRERRLRRIVQLSKYARGEDSRHEIPPCRLFSTRQQCSRLPYIYSQEEICKILEAASHLETKKSFLHPRTYYTLFGLLASTGLRISEALNLQFDDVTPDGLVIRNAKFQKSRLVPLHPTAKKKLDEYLRLRRKFDKKSPYVFLSTNHRPILYQIANRIFLRIVRRLGIHPGAGERGPRLHDLRHTMAVRSLESSSSNRDSVGRHIRALAIYMGHSNMASNFWYLHATPQLMKDICDVCEEEFGRE